MVVFSTAASLASLLTVAMWSPSVALVKTPSSSSSSSSLSPYDVLREATLVDPSTGEVAAAPLLPAKGEAGGRSTLVVVLPQLGDFDSAEFCDHLVAASPALDKAGVDLRVVGIGDAAAARRFAAHTELPLDALRVDPTAALHDRLGTHRGADWDVPDFVSDDLLTFVLNRLPGGAPDDAAALRPVGRAWFNYLLMCAGVGARGTIREILRGYLGDASAPERLASDAVVEVGDAIEIGPGVGPVRVGPFRYDQWFADERGYQRPVELATVRLRHMVEVLTNWNEYVSDPSLLDRRGATWLFDENGEVRYHHRHEGVLVYSDTMARPLTFLRGVLGDDVALNPLGLPDLPEDVVKNRRGRGVLKPAGKLMTLLSPVFSLENRLQARLTGVEEKDLAAARTAIDDAVTAHDVVTYTYGLSPFSAETKALLREAGRADVFDVEIGPEWFALGREGSALRAALLERTGQSSLPHVFVNGEHVGGLFSGGDADGSKGLANLYETRELERLLSSPRDEKATTREAATTAN